MGRRLTVLTTAAAVSVLLVAAAQPRPVLSQISAGLWEYSGRGGAPARRVCIQHMPMLAQVEHSADRCTRTVLRNDSALAVIEYRCASGGFAHSEITVLTPRSVRIETQGISGGAPFGYVAQARRVGDCRSH